MLRKVNLEIHVPPVGQFQSRKGSPTKPDCIHTTSRRMLEVTNDNEATAHIDDRYSFQTLTCRSSY